MCLALALCMNKLEELRVECPIHDVCHRNNRECQPIPSKRVHLLSESEYWEIRAREYELYEQMIREAQA